MLDVLSNIKTKILMFDQDLKQTFKGFKFLTLLKKDIFLFRQVPEDDEVSSRKGENHQSLRVLQEKSIYTRKQE